MGVLVLCCTRYIKKLAFKISQVLWFTRLLKHKLLDSVSLHSKARFAPINLVIVLRLESEAALLGARKGKVLSRDLPRIFEKNYF